MQRSFKNVLSVINEICFQKFIRVPKQLHIPLNKFFIFIFTDSRSGVLFKIMVLKKDRKFPESHIF